MGLMSTFDFSSCETVLVLEKINFLRQKLGDLWQFFKLVWRPLRFLDFSKKSRHDCLFQVLVSSCVFFDFLNFILKDIPL